MPSLIGVVDVPICQKNIVSHQINKLGGLPDWPAEDVGFSPKCLVCSQDLSLVVQLYCPLEGSNYHRTLYVFGCSNPPCWNRTESWIAVRSQVLDPQSNQSGKDTTVTAADDDDWGSGGDGWGVDADDWGVDAGDWGDIGDDSKDNISNKKDNEALVETGSNSRSQNEALLVSDGTKSGQDLEPKDSTTEAAGLQIENGDVSPDNIPLQQMYLDDVADDEEDTADQGSHIVVEDLPGGVPESRGEAMKALEGDSIRPSDLNRVLLPFFINVFEEPTSQLEDDHHVTELLRNYQQQEGIQSIEKTFSGSQAGGGAEKYEKTSVVHADAAFYKFIKRVSVCPEQCVRYGWGGSPLYIRPPGTGIPVSCEHCGGRVVFEAQLMPALVNSLKFPNHHGTTLEFGTVILFTCQQSCWTESDKYRTERLIVQADPDQEKFKV